MKTVKKLAQDYFDATDELKQALDGLPNVGVTCTCGLEDNKVEDFVQIIQEDSVDSFIQDVCLTCGGFVPLDS